MQKSNPYVIIAGLPRSGSTSLYTYLSAHPDICVSYKKETQFFLPVMTGGPVPDREEYDRFFKHCKNRKYLLEASPTYFFGGEELAKQILSYLGSVHIVLIFRDPTERLYSYFMHEKMVGNLPVDLSFHEYLQRPDVTAEEIIRHGNYCRLMKGWHKHFKGNIHIVYFEDLKQDPGQCVSGICDWLGLNSDCYHGYDFRIENKGVLFKNRFLHQWARNIFNTFEGFFRKHIKIKRVLRNFYRLVNEKWKENPAMDDETKKYIDSVYAPINKALHEFFSDHGYPVRGWLTDYQSSDSGVP